MRKSRVSQISPISALVPFLALLVTAHGFAQTRASAPVVQDPEAQNKIVCHLVDLVTIKVEVKDQSGWHILNLTKDDFNIYEDGEPQQMFFFYTSRNLTDAEELTDTSTFSTVYTIGYSPTDMHRDGRPRKIRIRIRDGEDRGLKARWRPTSYTPQPAVQ